MRSLTPAAAYVVWFLVVAALTFGTLYALAGSSFAAWLVGRDLDGWFIGIAGWGAVLVLPPLLAHFVSKRLGRGAPPR